MYLQQEAKAEDDPPPQWLEYSIRGAGFVVNGKSDEIQAMAMDTRGFTPRTIGWNARFKHWYEIAESLHYKMTWGLGLEGLYPASGK